MKHFFELLKVVAAFAGHIIASALVFCVVGLGALVIHVFRHWMEVQGIDELVLAGMQLLEWLIFGCDFVATGAWSIMSTWKVIKELKEKK